MTISATYSKRTVTISNDDPVRSETYPASVIQRGHRGIGAQIKRDMGLGPGGQSAVTKQMFDDIAVDLLTEAVPNVVGMTAADAKGALADVRLVFAQGTGSSDPVASQDPAASTVVAINSTVTCNLT